MFEEAELWSVIGVCVGIVSLILFIVGRERIVIWLLKIWSAPQKVGKYTITPILRAAIEYILDKLRSLYNTGLNTLRRRYCQVNFYLFRRGIVKMKLDFTGIPNVPATWTNPHLKDDRAKAGYLALNMSRHINHTDDNQATRFIKQLCGPTPITSIVLENKVLDRDVFCALVSAYIIENANEDYDSEHFKSFPIPYSVVEEIIKDLFGEENEEAHDTRFDMPDRRPPTS